MAIAGAVQILTIKRTKNKIATIIPMASVMRDVMPEEQYGEVLHIVVAERDEV